MSQEVEDCVIANSDEEQYYDEGQYLYDSEYGESFLPSGEFSDDQGFSSANNLQNSPCCKYKVISCEQLLEEQNNAIDLLSGVMKCHKGLARALLIHFQWRYEPLMEAWSENGLEQLLYQAKISQIDNNTASQAEEQIICQVCYCQVNLHETCTMACGHCFCRDCWRRHFVSQISEGKGRRLSCMAVKCGILFEEDKVQDILSQETRSLQIYQKALKDSFVDSQKCCCWCPSVPHCGAAIIVFSDFMEEPICNCGLKFCFSCLEEAHSPVTCDQWKLWTVKNRDDSETSNWLNANCQSCPKCGKMVQKNGGCNLVVCLCGQAFCWICGAATGRAHTWEKIEGHECGRYREETQNNVTEAKRQLDRYLHYFNRFKAHRDSISKECELQGDLSTMVEILLTQDVKSISQQELAWIKGAAETLLEARRIISNSYALAFYIFDYQYVIQQAEIARQQGCSSVEIVDQNSWVIKQVLFEDQQQMLEQGVERLSGLLQDFLIQEDRQSGSIADVRYSSLNLARTIHMRLKNLYQVVEDELLPYLGDGEATITTYMSIQI